MDASPRRGLIYFSDDGDVLGLRFDNWKVVSWSSRCEGTLKIWQEPFTALRAPKIFQPAHRPVRAGRHHVEHLLRWISTVVYMAFYAGAIVTQFLETFKSSRRDRNRRRFTINHAVKKLHEFLAKD